MATTESRFTVFKTSTAAYRAYAHDIIVMGVYLSGQRILQSNTS